MPDLVIVDAPDRSRYQAAVDDRPAGILDYALTGDVLVLPHTEVLDGFEGQGVGSQLVRRALDDARAAGRRVIPACPFVRTWIQRHPEYTELVADGA